MSTNSEQSPEESSSAPQRNNNFFLSLLRYLFGLFVVFLIIDVFDTDSFDIFQLQSLSSNSQVKVFSQLFLTICIMNFLIYFERLAEENTPSGNSKIGLFTRKKHKITVLEEIGLLIYGIFLQYIDWVDLKISNRWLINFLFGSTLIFISLTWYEDSCLSPASFQVIEKGGVITEVLDGGAYLLENGETPLLIKIIEKNTGEAPEECRNWDSVGGKLTPENGSCEAGFLLQKINPIEIAIIQVDVRHCILPTNSPWTKHSFDIIAP